MQSGSSVLSYTISYCRPYLFTHNRAYDPDLVRILHPINTYNHYAHQKNKTSFSIFNESILEEPKYIGMPFFVKDLFSRSQGLTPPLFACILKKDLSPHLHPSRLQCKAIVVILCVCCEQFSPAGWMYSDPVSLRLGLRLHITGIRIAPVHRLFGGLGFSHAVSLTLRKAVPSCSTVCLLMLVLLITNLLKYTLCN